MKIFAAIIGLASFASAQAATITQIGTDVTFTYDNATLYGTGTVVGNSIFFSPTTFKAESLDAAGTVTASATLNIVVEVTTMGFAVNEFKLLEQGDYRLVGSSSSVDASGWLQVTSQTKTCGFFACFDNETFSAGALTTVGSLTPWSAYTEVDLANTAGWVSDTKVNAQIQNNLLAISTVFGESAMVQKKFQGVGLVINPDTAQVIPLPAAVWLLGSAIGALGWMRRRN